MSSNQRGATLIELIVAIVIISIAITGVILGTSRITRGSADPMIYAQAQAIAEAYLEEALGKGFACSGGPDGKTRPEYDEVDDYETVSYVAVADQEGNAVPELAGYQVSVTVDCQALNGIVANDAARVVVRVRNTGFNNGDAAVLTGYKARL